VGTLLMASMDEAGASIYAGVPYVFKMPSAIPERSVHCTVRASDWVSQGNERFGRG
jgi:hypothetical protein